MDFLSIPVLIGAIVVMLVIIAAFFGGLYIGYDSGALDAQPSNMLTDTELANFVDTAVASANLHRMTAHVKEWADGTFPERDIKRMFLKLYEEIGEWVGNPRDGMEAADILIMLVDGCQLMDIDLVDSFYKKMAINRQRTWEKDETTNIHRHIPMARGTIGHE